MSPFWDNDWLTWDITETEDATGSLGGSSNLVYFGAYPAGERQFLTRSYLLVLHQDTPPSPCRYRNG